MSDFDFSDLLDKDGEGKKIKEPKQETTEKPEEEPKPAKDSALDEFIVKRQRILTMLDDRNIMLPTHLNYFKVGELKIVVYQGSRDNPMAIFQFRYKDVFDI